jgi:hypothetical protein
VADISVAELRAHIGSVALPDAALQQIIDDIQEEIDERWPATAVAQTFRPGEWNGPLVLSRPAASITSIIETLYDTSRMLDPADYSLEGAYRLYRLTTGPTPAYGFAGSSTVVTYVPRAQTARRKMAIVDVAKLELAHSGYISRRIGDWSESTGGGQGSESLEERRSRILRKRLAPKPVLA